MSALRARASSRPKNGFPPDVSWRRSNVWRGNGLPRRSCSSRWRAPTLSGPTGTRWRRSADSACSSNDGRAPSATRCARSTRMLFPPSLRSANTSALDDDESSHWTSSTAIRSGLPSLRSWSASRTATASARSSTRPSDPSSRRSAARSARRRAAERAGRMSSRRSSNRSPSPR